MNNLEVSFEDLERISEDLKSRLIVRRSSSLDLYLKMKSDNRQITHNLRHYSQGIINDLQNDERFFHRPSSLNSIIHHPSYMKRMGQEIQADVKLLRMDAKAR